MLEILLTLAVIASTIFSLCLLMLPSRYVSPAPSGTTASSSATEFKTKSKTNVSVQVLVLGDIGRSPRMQYHAMSIAKHNGTVDLIGYKESPLHPGLVGNPQVTVVPLPAPPRFLQKVPFILAGPVKVLWQILSLLNTLSYGTKPARWLLVQNPPSIPTLFIALLVCFFRNTQLIIDWHNYGWTILAGTRGASHPFVRISKLYEAYLGRVAPAASFTVSNAMAEELKKEPYRIRSPIFTLHDRPAAIFQPLSDIESRHGFLARLPETSAHAEDIIQGKIKLLVSSTSWTPDEDFNLLLNALCSYSSSSSSSLPSILAIITGKGPQKELYLERIAVLTTENKLNNVIISTAWLTSEDYAMLLACADLGVCLHMSSSGVDLPMKVVDMFGAGLPVVGYGNYASWGELVEEGVNGRGFVKSEELAKILRDLFRDSKCEELLRLKRGAIKEGSRRWDDEWNGIAGRLLGLCE